MNVSWNPSEHSLVFRELLYDLHSEAAWLCIGQFHLSSALGWYAILWGVCFVLISASSVTVLYIWTPVLWGRAIMYGKQYLLCLRRLLAILVHAEEGSRCFSSQQQIKHCLVLLYYLLFPRSQDPHRTPGYRQVLLAAYRWGKQRHGHTEWITAWPWAVDWDRTLVCSWSHALTSSLDNTTSFRESKPKSVGTEPETWTVHSW